MTKYNLVLCAIAILCIGQIYARECPYETTTEETTTPGHPPCKTIVDCKKACGFYTFCENGRCDCSQIVYDLCDLDDCKKDCIEQGYETCDRMCYCRNFTSDEVTTQETTTDAGTGTTESTPPSFTLGPFQTYIPGCTQELCDNYCFSHFTSFGGSCSNVICTCYISTTPTFPTSEATTEA